MRVCVCVGGGGGGGGVAPADLVDADFQNACTMGSWHILTGPLLAGGCADEFWLLSPSHCQSLAI